MSLPQHSGDLILPWPSGHSAMRTSAPPSRTRTSSRRSAPQWPQVVLTDMSQEEQVYTAMG